MPTPAQLNAADREVLSAWERAGQGHVARFLGELTRAEAEQLVAELRSVDPAHVVRLISATDADGAGGDLEPPGDELVRVGDSAADRRLRAEAAQRGAEEIGAGRVAVVVAAGGQGTRLGSPAPKGMWPAGPLTGKPLLHWHAEKVLHWSRKTGRTVPFVILVSDATAAATQDFLQWHRWFGMDPTWVRLVKQRSLPAVDAEGRVLLATKSSLALAPNGHGGLYAALAESGVLGLLEDHGVRSLAYCQVDNPLIRTLDPAFVGFHVLRGAQFSSKSVAKRSPDEKVGVFARAGGTPCVVEYSELTDAQSRATDAAGALQFGQGNIAAHVIDLAFARSVSGRGLPHHRALKKVEHVDDAGALVRPERPNGVKFESFVFDALPWAQATLVLETLRSDEFSPIKNAEGEDSPDTARRDLIAQFRAWHKNAGVPCGSGALEVSPLVAPDEDAFRSTHGLAPR